MRKALGLIETYGYVGAIEAADASLKAANVNLAGCEIVKGGIVTIEIVGDVGAVRAAVDAGGAAASKIGQLRSTHVIPRPAECIEELILARGAKQNEVLPAEGGKPQEVPLEIKQVRDELKADEEPKEPVGMPSIPESREELESMKTVDLRNLARHLEGISIERKDIKFARKEQLVEAILEFYERKSK